MSLTRSQDDLLDVSFSPPSDTLLSYSAEPSRPSAVPYHTPSQARHTQRWGHLYEDIHEGGHIHFGDSYPDAHGVPVQTLDFGRLETRFLDIQPGLTRFGEHGHVSTVQNQRYYEAATLPVHGRVLTVQNRVEASPWTGITCDMSTASLFACPKYTALSYSWGDHSAKRLITVKGRVTQVTASLETALKELRTRGVDVVWVDALCIDQKNDYEKVYQLSQMGKIFSKASKVVVWLGPAADDSDHAMKALSAAENRDEVVRHSVAIAKLLERPYWQRVWIIQEIAKASVVEVWCGPQTLTWDVFFAGVQQWWQTQSHHVSGFHHPIFTLKYFCDAEKQSRKRAARMLLSAAMVRTLYAKATLRRDKVYALLGIVRDGTETVPTPNYVQDDVHVFDDILRHMIVEQGQLNLALFAGSRKTSKASPSWLPDWTDERSLEASPWLLRCFEGNGETTGDGEVQCHEGVLKVSGQILGPLLTEASFEVETSSLPEARRFLLRVAWHMLSCNGSINPGRFVRNNLSYALAALWSHSVPVAQFPKLQEWYQTHEVTGFASKTLRSSVARVNGLDSVDEYRSWLQAPNGLPPGDSWLMDALACLEVSVSKMLHHQMKLCGMERHGQIHLIVVPATTKRTCFVARLQNCSLPVVLRAESETEHSLVGEVVEEPEWHIMHSLHSYRRRHYLQGFSFVPEIGGVECKEEQQEDEDGDSFLLFINSIESDVDRCWYGVDKEPWRELELT